jgi:multiple sugar transport system ATP-binding protein
MSLCTLPVGGDGTVELGGRRVAANGAAQGREAVVVGLRPESLELASDGVPARVQVVEELGADAFVFCTGEVGGAETRLVARTDPHHPPAVGQRVNLRMRGGEAHLFDPDTGVRL